MKDSAARDSLRILRNDAELAILVKGSLSKDNSLAVALRTRQASHQVVFVQNGEFFSQQQFMSKAGVPPVYQLAEDSF